MRTLQLPLVVLVAWFVGGGWTPADAAEPQVTKDVSPVPGENSLTSLNAYRDSDGRWMVSFTYFYTGSPHPAWLSITLGPEPGTPAADDDNAAREYGFAEAPTLELGRHQVVLPLKRSNFTTEAYVTRQVTAKLWAPRMITRESIAEARGKAVPIALVLASQQINQIIEWPDLATWSVEDMYASKSPNELLDHAIQRIDAGDEWSLSQAKRVLERLIAKKPTFDAAYVELARVAMKSNWGPEGLHQAEALLQSALRISPDSANAKILLGYVYAHQKRYQRAESLFAEAATTGTNNLWLWTNWGEVLTMQGKVEQGIDKYRKATSHPRTFDTYDRARLDAYWHLIALLEKRGDIDGQESFYRQRAEEYGPGNCYYAGYARFVLRERGDARRATTLARSAMDGGVCQEPDAREVLGLANYLAWAEAPAESRAQFLNQAYVYLPIGPRPIYLLATSEKTTVAIRKLLETGESIDQRDNNNWNALAYAVLAKNYSAQSRLVRLGARTDSLVGSEKVPVALLPVFQNDADGVRLMRKLGVDYSKVHYHGASILGHVKRSGNRELLEAMGPRANAL